MLKLSKINPLMAIVLCAFFISFSGVWVTTANVSPINSAFYRVFFGFIFLLIVTLHTRDFPPVNSSKIGLITLCALLFAVDLICWHASIIYIGPGLATILGNFQVFFLTIIGIFFLKEKISPLFIAAVPLAVVGLFLILGFQWSTLDVQYKKGIFLGLATACCYTGFLLSLKAIQSNGRQLSFYHSLMLISLVCSLILAIYMWINNISFIIPDMKSFLS